VSNDAEELRQKDVQDEGKAVVHGVQVGAEPVEDSTEWSCVEKDNLKTNANVWISQI
jgi:hypothetical protein